MLQEQIQEMENIKRGSSEGSPRRLKAFRFKGVCKHILKSEAGESHLSTFGSSAGAGQGMMAMAQKKMITQFKQKMKEELTRMISEKGGRLARSLLARGAGYAVSGHVERRVLNPSIKIPACNWVHKCGGIPKLLIPFFR